MAGRTVRSSVDPHLKRWLDPFFLSPFRAVRIHDGEDLTFHPHLSCEVLWNLRGPVAPPTCAMAIGDHPTMLTPFKGMVNRLISTYLDGGFKANQQCGGPTQYGPEEAPSALLLNQVHSPVQ